MEFMQNKLIDFLKWLMVNFINCSYWICLFSCILALILYIAGLKKAGKYVSVSFVIYFFLQSIKGAFLK